MSTFEHEREIQAKGLTGPRIKPADIEANIASEHYFTALQGARMAGIDWMQQTQLGDDPMPAPHAPELGLLTFCVLVLRNGFTVTGESACASPENFDVKVGRAIARQNAVAKVWPLMGYALRSHLAAETASIHINGRQQRWNFVGDGPSVSYEVICAKAGVNVSRNPTVVWGVKGSNDGGALTSGQSLPVVDGMIFSVAVTGNA